MMEEDSTLDLCQQIGSRCNGKLEGFLLSILEHRKSLRDGLAIVKPDFRLPETERLPGCPVKMYTRHPADVV